MKTARANRTPHVLALLAPLGFLFTGPAAAARGAQDPVELVEQSGTISIDQARARIAELEAAAQDDPELDKRVVEVYRQIVQRLEAEQSARERAEAYRLAIETAPAETTFVRDELKQLAAAAEPAALPEDATASTLQQRLIQAQAELADARSRQAEQERLIEEAGDRPDKALTQLAEARTVLAQIRTALAASPPPADAPEADRAAYGLLQARSRARTAEIQMLEQELLSSAARTDLLVATRDLTARRVTLAEAKVKRIEAWTSELRQAEAERARQEAERLRLEAIGKHPLIRAATDEIAAASREAEGIGPRIDAARARRAEVEAQLAQLAADKEETKRTLDLQISESLGAVLLEQRRAVPDASVFRRNSDRRSADMAKDRLRLFKIDRELKQLLNPAQAAAQRIEQWDGAPLEEAGRLQLEELLATKRENLQRLSKAYRDHLAALASVDARERELEAGAAELAEILDARLLWIPNAPPLSPAMLRDVRDGIEWLFSAEVRDPLGRTLAADWKRIPWAYALAALLLLAVSLVRRGTLDRLETIGAKIGRVREDGMLLTCRALALHVLHALPIPAAVCFVGWRLSAVSDPSTASASIGAGLVAAACTAFVLQLLRSIFLQHGVAIEHFRWRLRSGRLVRRHLLGFMLVAVPAMFVFTVAEQQRPDSFQRLGLGRMSFIVMMIAVAVLAWVLLRREHGLFTPASTARASVWLRRTRPAWLPVGVLVPLALAGLAGAGYHYAALQLDYRLNQTVALILAAVFLHAFLMRWLLVSQRRLALKVALDKRAAQAKSRESGESDADVENVVDNFDDIDVSEIKEQTQDLLRAAIGLVIVVGLWFAWVGVLPALRILDTVKLWPHQVLVDGQEEMVWITLTHVVGALIAVLVTITAARNMPGFLEIALLQRLGLDSGTRYATRTLVLYAIVTIGVLVAFNAIGVGWNSVQWLLAALTVGLGFGLQEIFANFVSGLIILLERPVRVGDTVTVAGVSGVVTRIRMRATTITDWSRRELVVPNKNFITGELINWSLSDPILRLEFGVGVAYGSDTTLAQRTMLEACKEHPMVLDQPEPNVFFVRFGDNSLEFEARVFVSEPTNTGRSRILHDLHMAIDKACREKDITIAFPQRDLHLKTAEAVIRVEQIGRGARGALQDVPAELHTDFPAEAARRSGE